MRIAISVAGAVVAAWIWSADPAVAGSGFVDVDAVAVDAGGRPIVGLKAEDFSVREDDRPAAILTVEEISDGANRYAHEDRSIALVLDDLSVLPASTSNMQSIAGAFLSRVTATDRVAVLRLGDREEEPFFGHLADALLRIRNYAALGRVSFDDESVGGWLTMVANISRQFGEADGRRKTIVAVGSPALLDPAEPRDRSRHGPRSKWIDAIGSAARNNAALYVIDPSGIAAPLRATGAGLTEQTGGMLFSTIDLAWAFDQIWRDISHYYVLSYVPQQPKRLHSIAVSARRRGVRVRARRFRGE